MADLESRLEAYLGARIEGARDVRVADLARIHGGASRETYRFTVRWTGTDGVVERGLILRRDPTSSLIETERELEFAAYRAFHGSGVPVPEPLFFETDSSWLERPFFVMEEIAGCQASPMNLATPPYSDVRDKIGEAKWRILGRIARTDVSGTDLGRTLDAPAPRECWSRELSRWEKVLDDDEIDPQPIVRAAIRRLRREPPPPAERVGVVHGDYRTGNFLYDESGEVRAILDWEMCHLGDPLEDLAWALTPLWAWPDASKPGKLIARERALELWEKESGLEIDAKALAWWELFSCVKGIAIWTSSAREFVDGKSRAPIMVAAAWYATDIHNRVLVDMLAPNAEVAA
jgi:aminoglycoside phosphotransferase (APT) family kinase protein